MLETSGGSAMLGTVDCSDDGGMACTSRDGSLGGALDEGAIPLARELE